MWRSPAGDVIDDSDQYVAENGTTYPWNFPKSEIPGLTPVAFVSPPSITEYQTAAPAGIEFVDGEWHQAWAILDWTQEQIDAHKRLQVPRVVSMAQARQALHQAGLLMAVNNAVASMSGSAGDAARIDWEFRAEVHRDRALVKSMAETLGFTEDQLDELFIAAAAVQ